MILKTLLLKFVCTVVAGVGNTTVLSEFNFRVDPESAFVTLADYICPIVITPWEVCKRQNHKASLYPYRELCHFPEVYTCLLMLQEFRLNVLASVDSPQAELLNKIEHQNVQKIRWSPCDALATAVLIEPKVIKLLKRRIQSVPLI